MCNCVGKWQAQDSVLCLPYYYSLKLNEIVNIQSKSVDGILILIKFED